MTENATVAILGASNKPDRYSYMALHMLEENGHTPFPVHPKLKEIENHPVYPSLKEVPRPIDTLTIYLNPTRLAPLLPDIIDLKPRRVIFNPGTESPDLYPPLKDNGIEIVNACTLVLLRTHQF